MTSMSSGKIIRIAISSSLIPTGAVFVLLAVEGTVGQLISNIGLALIVAGVISLFREIAIRSTELQEQGEYIAKKVYELLEDSPIGASGIRLVAPTRKGFEGFSSWALKRGRQNLFFVGRSVLHRIDADFRDLGIGSVEEVIARRLGESANITILFLNPQSEVIDKLANEENRDPIELVSDLAKSIGICQRLGDRLSDTRFGPNAELHIRVYDEVPYFAYHREDDTHIVGFYFAPTLGSFSPAFEIIDKCTQDFFDRHFATVYNKARILLELLPNENNIRFNDLVYNDLHEALVRRLGIENTDILIRGNSR